MSRIIENLYLEFYNYDIIMVSVFDLLKIYLELLRKYRSNRICYLLL